MLSVLAFNNCYISRLIECTATLLIIGYCYFQAGTGLAPNNGDMAAIVGQMDTDGVQWDELKTCGLYLVPVDCHGLYIKKSINSKVDTIITLLPAEALTVVMFMLADDYKRVFPPGQL